MSMVSAFDILGPIMVGPSSSHTAGALRCAKLAASLTADPIKKVTFTLYNSFAHTYQGHGTDRALLGGIMGLEPDDERIRFAFDLADERGLIYEFIPSDQGEGRHPNTVDFDLTSTSGERVSARGESLGGGAVTLSRINDVEVSLTGGYNALFVAHRDQCGVLAALCTLLGDHGVNIAFMRSYRQEVGGMAYTVFETDSPVDPESLAAIRSLEFTSSATVIDPPSSGAPSPGLTSVFDFTSGAELLARCTLQDKSIGELMYLRECDIRSEHDVIAEMHRVHTVMRDGVQGPINQPQTSLGGMIGGEAQLVYKTQGTKHALTGTTMTRAIAYAMATLERSATMGIICAAPTAGSAGVLPGALLALADHYDFTDEQVERALFTAAALGHIIARNATVAGAEGGCQAEVGSASGMAAAAIVELLGGTPEMALHAASLAIADILGLVCDPIRGLVEAPCQTRNAMGVTNAITSAQLALAGVVSHVPFDEVVEAMFAVGRALPAALRETALGGIAACPSACQLDHDGEHPMQRANFGCHGCC